MQQVNNMGSLLQAYALKKILEDMNVDVEFIDIKKIDKDYELLGDYKQQFAEENESTGFVEKFRKLNKYTLNRVHIRKKSREQDIEFDKFRSLFLKIENKSQFYDICVIGSDEVFNCLNSGKWGFTSQLFGNVPEAKKVITYAASCGSTRYEELPINVSYRIKEIFKKVEGFSVRDDNTHNFIAKLTENEIITDNLDPVLIYNFDKEINCVKMLNLPESYCVIYSYYNRIHTSEEISKIKDFCKKNNMVPIAVGAPQFWVKKYIVCSPFQCLKIFQNASFVITDTFHGTIFSAKYAKKFAVIVRESNRNKLLDLVNKIGVSEHLLNKLDELNDKNKLIHDKTNFDFFIKAEREKTFNYLYKHIW